MSAHLGGTRFVSFDFIIPPTVQREERWTAEGNVKHVSTGRNRRYYEEDEAEEEGELDDQLAYEVQTASILPSTASSVGLYKYLWIITYVLTCCIIYLVFLIFSEWSMII